MATRQRPTQSEPLTTSGTILGTLPYMAPEQVEGREADSRSDVWAFGCVVYEMATGRRAFAGDSQARLINAILEHHPLASASHGAKLPNTLGRVIDVCLAKDPDERWQSIADAKRTLGWAGQVESTREQSSPSAIRSWRRERFAWMAGVVLAAIAAASITSMVADRSTGVPAAATRTTVILPATHELDLRDGAAPLALSPDGRQLAYVAGSEGSVALYLRDLDEFEDRQLPGTENARKPEQHLSRSRDRTRCPVPLLTANPGALQHRLYSGHSARRGRCR